MGTKIEINDTLALTTAQGFPSHLLSVDHISTKTVGIEDVVNHVFEFQKDEARIFHLDPVRVFLVQNIGGKWLHWGQVLIQSQTISKVLEADGSWKGEWLTSGTYKIVKLHESEYQRLVTFHESPAGKSYF